MIGPHKRAGRRRRKLKAVVIVLVLLMMLLTSNWTPWTPPEPPKPEPSIQELAVKRNLYSYSGDNGEVHEFLLTHPEYAAYVRGEIDDPTIRVPTCD